MLLWNIVFYTKLIAFFSFAIIHFFFLIRLLLPKEKQTVELYRWLGKEKGYIKKKKSTSPLPTPV